MSKELPCQFCGAKEKRGCCVARIRWKLEARKALPEYVDRYVWLTWYDYDIEKLLAEIAKKQIPVIPLGR